MHTHHIDRPTLSLAALCEQAQPWVERANEIAVWRKGPPVECRDWMGFRNLSTTLKHRRLRFTEQSLLLWIWQVG